MRVLCTLILFAFAATTWGRGLSADAQKAKAGYNAIMHDASLPENQLYFIACFPDTKDKFIKTFGPHTSDQLYPNYPEYLAAYRKFGSRYPRQAMPKTLLIAKGLVWSGGPVAALHEILLTLANDNPEMFVEELKKLKSKEQKAIIIFIADTINPEPFPAFQSLMDKLGAQGEVALQQQMAAAFEEQQKFHKKGQ